MTLLVVCQVLPVEEDNQSISAAHSIPEEWLGSHLPGHARGYQGTHQENHPGNDRVFQCGLIIDERF